MSVKISLTGDIGSGKSTVAKELIERTGFERYSTGTAFRALAAEMGMTVVELNLYAQTHPEIDGEIDSASERLSDDPRDLIIDSRMAWHFCRGTFKVYLSVSGREAAKRIFADKRDVETFPTLEMTEAKITERKQSENRRYKELYNVDFYDMRNYDLVVDTTFVPASRAADVILENLELYKKGGFVRTVYMSPKRLVPAGSAASDGGEITVSSEDNVFSVVSGAELIDPSADLVKARLI
ncbi:MAG: cytidylate kinase family protein [Clostridia bacterium]|nr:cytidylate kinase family protein [Clostridia bacterium]